MSFNKRVIGRGTALVSALLLSAISFSQSSYASDTPSSHDTHEPHSATIFKSPTHRAKPLAVAVAPTSGCVKTNSTPHKPIKVGYPDREDAMVDRVFTLNTNCGLIVFKAFGKKAVSTVIAMSFLAKSGYFDHSLCQRITTAGIFFLQCGDPTASGSGGPPFTYPDENLPGDAPNNYPAGTIAMANSGPSTNGSQFFIVYKDTYLPPSYTIWGVVTQGLDIVKRVAASGVLGGGNDGTPKMTIAIESVSVN